MPWNMNDYPSSWKNLDSTIRKKAIEIGNSMLEDGYKEGDAIPIATEQAKKWYADASEEEKNEMKQTSQKDLESRKEDDDARPELMEKEVFVVPHEEGWAVQSEDAKQPSNVYDKKQDAVERAQEIAENKQTSVVVHKKDNSVEKKYNYSEK
ncbi:DUF2188 domain-containing protein [Alkalicoccus daliensis]|uniref:Uncharacterized protein YdaT n=1 Tax=Alkalicoccus daliensis TaxID=745820 RepID=A0A1H0I1X7_9BACI|nr:DUF2188 domain-containing protein [Alkalicoccus daliensis]SDO25374.1 Uncharacterized protein YdaT [Alkalicoccus daliensis]